MAANSEAVRPRPWVRTVVIVAVVAALLYAFPLFHLVRLNAPHDPVGLGAAITERGGPAARAPTNAADQTTFNATHAAERLWSDKLIPAAAKATDVASIADAPRHEPAAAVKRYGHAVGIGGTAYFFVRGEGKVVARTHDAVRLALAGGSIVELSVGPVFGNTVRDGTGLLNVNDFPGLEEFNALSAELNHLVETRIEPTLREKAVVGATVTFAGCAEAPESAPAAEAPVLSIVPIAVEVRP